MATHEELPVPVYSSLEAVYGEGSQLEEAQLRFDVLKSKFVEVYGKAPELFARSPGQRMALSVSLPRICWKRVENCLIIWFNEW